MDIPRLPGVYALILKISSSFKTVVGRLGEIRFDKGLYVYVGSALGPGGLRARIFRHLKRDKRIHWHIDYLTTHREVEVVAVVYALTRSSLEEKIANTMCKYLDIAVKHFGSTDKHSVTHLFKCVPSDLHRCMEVVYRVFRENNLTPCIRYTTDLNTYRSN